MDRSAEPEWADEIAMRRHQVSALAAWTGRTIRQWNERVAFRRDLARMDAHLLRDLGLTPGDAREEAAKPFWRA